MPYSTAVLVMCIKTIRKGKCLPTCGKIEKHMVESGNMISVVDTFNTVFVIHHTQSSKEYSWFTETVCFEALLGSSPYLAG